MRNSSNILDMAEERRPDSDLRRQDDEELEEGELRDDDEEVEPVCGECPEHEKKHQCRKERHASVSEKERFYRRKKKKKREREQEKEKRRSKKRQSHQGSPKSNSHPPPSMGPSPGGGDMANKITSTMKPTGQLAQKWDVKGLDSGTGDAEPHGPPAEALGGPPPHFPDLSPPGHNEPSIQADPSMARDPPLPQNMLFSHSLEDNLSFSPSSPTPRVSHPSQQATSKPERLAPETKENEVEEGMLRNKPLLIPLEPLIGVTLHDPRIQLQKYSHIKRVLELKLPAFAKTEQWSPDDFIPIRIPEQDALPLPHGNTDIPISLNATECYTQSSPCFPDV